MKTTGLRRRARQLARALGACPTVAAWERVWSARYDAAAGELKQLARDDAILLRRAAGPFVDVDDVAHFLLVTAALWSEGYGQ